MSACKELEKGQGLLPAASTKSDDNLAGIVATVAVLLVIALGVFYWASNRYWLRRKEEMDANVADAVANYISMQETSYLKSKD